MLSPYIFTGLEKNADLFEMLALRVPHASLDAHTHPGRFTAREALAHWADWEHIHLSRIEAALREDLVQVPDVDEGERARAERYTEWEVEESVERFTAGRTLLVQRLRSLGPDETERRFVHPFFGSLTVGGYCGHILGHDAYHAEQLLCVVLAP